MDVTSVIDLAGALSWPLLAVVLIAPFRGSISRFVEAVVVRTERGDSLELGSMLTIGSSTGKLLDPPPNELVKDDNLALIHRSWRVPDRDAEFGGQPMYQIHVIVYGPAGALDRVEYVVYRLDRAYPNPVRATSDRANRFELKELANGFSLLRAEVWIAGQTQPVRLSRFIDLMDESPSLKDSFHQ